MPSIVYKEWLPDQPALGNPGLIEALNVLPLNSGYSPFKPLDNSMATAPATAIAGACVVSGASKGSISNYILADNIFYETQIAGLTAYTSRGTAGGFPTQTYFAQIDNLLIASGENDFRLMRHTLGSTSNFATLAATAPYADVVSIVNRFVVAGGLYVDEGSGTISASRSNVISWSGIDDPSNWPTPNSATAIAVQSGEQEFLEQYGPVTGIHGGDQFAVALQQGAVTRMTYVGPPVVFQFDVISNEYGSFFRGGSVMADGLTYFISSQGFCRTDGVQIERIGLGKVDRYFWDSPPATIMPSVAHDPVYGLIYFSYDSKLLIFNIKTGQWTHATQSLRRVITPAPSISISNPPKILGISNATLGILGEFDATAGTAVFVTGEMELTEAGRTYMDGVKPNVESSSTAPAITCRIGYRDSLDTAPSYTSTTSPLARTGVANFRVDAKYHRIETQIVGNFSKATGVEFDAQDAGRA